MPGCPGLVLSDSLVGSEHKQLFPRTPHSSAGFRCHLKVVQGQWREKSLIVSPLLSGRLRGSLL